VSFALQQLVKSLDIPILFGLHNFDYHDAGAFRMADHVIVPTEFCRQYYWDALGLASLKLPLVMDGERVRVERSSCGSHAQAVGQVADHGVRLGICTLVCP